VNCQEGGGGGASTCHHDEVFRGSEPPKAVILVKFEACVCVCVCVCARACVCKEEVQFAFNATKHDNHSGAVPGGHLFGSDF
jgi:hypothetical protein